MKLRVSVEGRVYEVQVEPIEGSVPGFVEAAVLPGRDPVRAGPAPTEAKLTREEEGRSHFSSDAARPGEVLAPMSGQISAVHVKIGDAVLPGDAVATLAVERTLSPGEAPFIGTVRSLRGGTVRDVLVRAGQSVGVRAVLVKIV